MITYSQPRNLLKNLFNPKSQYKSDGTQTEYFSIEKLQNLSDEKKKKIIPILFKTRPNACYLERNKIFRNKDRGREVIKELNELELRYYYLFAKRISLYEIARTIANNNNTNPEPVYKDVSQFFLILAARRVCYAAHSN